MPFLFYKKKAYAERRPAPHVRLALGFKLEPPCSRYIINHRAVDVLLANWIKKEFNAILLNHRVIGTGLSSRLRLY